MSSKSYRPFKDSDTKASTRLTTSVSLLAAAISMASFGTQAADQEEEFFLEEIVVTAQKREQNLQEVPIAITAVSGDQLVEAVIQDVFDLQTNTPGLRVNQEENGNATQFEIRGIGSSSSNYGVESSVGLYVDGVYRSRQSSMINDMIDMEAVEILRGPQGTLFGKNTAAGAVHFRTKAPSHETDGFASITAGNQDMLNASAGGNLSIIEDVLAVRGTVFSSKRDGYIDAEGFGDDKINDRDRWGARLQALITPSDDLSIRVIADYSKIDESCCGALTIMDNRTVYDTDPDSNDFGTQGPGSDWVLENYFGGTLPEGDVTDTFSTNLNSLPESNSKDQGLSVEVNWDLGDYTFTSLSSYREFDSYTSGDVDFTNVDLISTNSSAKMDYFSQEFRLDYSTDRMNAVVGAYYFQQDLEVDRNLDAGAALSEFFLAGDLGDFVDGINDTLAGVPAFGAFIPVPTRELFPEGFRSSNSSKQDSTSWALFGQLDYNLTEELTLTAGLRYTKENKDLSNTFSETINGVPWVPGQATSSDAVGATADAMDLLGTMGDPSLILADTTQFLPYASAGWGGFLFDSFVPREDLKEKLNDSQISGNLKLSWLMSEDMMVYASYSTGYKSGGLNPTRVPVGVSANFDAETTETFEVGIKAEFPEQALRINAAVHYTSMDDFQANTFNGTSFVLRNAGERTASGLELEAFWQPAQNTEVSLGYAYTNNWFDSYEGASCWVASPKQNFDLDTSLVEVDGNDVCDRSGEGDPSHFATLGVKQSFTVADGVEGYVFGEYSYLSDQDESRDPLKTRDAYGLLNLRAGVYFEESEINLTLWGRNVLDEEYLAADSFDAPIQDGKLLGFVGAPATYGITLNKDF